MAHRVTVTHATGTGQLHRPIADFIHMVLLLLGVLALGWSGYFCMRQALLWHRDLKTAALGNSRLEDLLDGPPAPGVRTGYRQDPLVEPVVDQSGIPAGRSFEAYVSDGLAQITVLLIQESRRHQR